MNWIKTTDKEIPRDEMVIMCLEVIRGKDRYFDVFVAKINLSDGMLEYPNGDSVGWDAEDVDYWATIAYPKSPS